MQKATAVMHKTLRLLGAGIHTAGPGKDYPSHAHTSWELVYYVRGRITCPVGDETYAATPGTVLLTPPQTWHAELSRTGYTNRFLQVDATTAWPWPRNPATTATGSPRCSSTNSTSCYAVPPRQRP
jgi:hypothetical protein